MAILYSEVVYRKGAISDYSDATLNGGPLGDTIVNDTLNSIFPEITATEREAGVTRRTKIFITNESSSRTMKDTLISIGQDILPPEKLRLFEAQELAKIGFTLSEDLSGGTIPIAAGTTISIRSITAGSIASDLVGRRIKLGEYEYNVSGSTSSTEISFSDPISSNLLDGELAKTSDMYDSVESEESFTEANAYVNSVTSSSFQNGSSHIDIALGEKVHYATGDNFIILDGYYRVIFRGEITGVQDHSTDANLATLDFGSPYNGTQTIPAGAGFVAGAFKRTIKPGDTVSMWAELIVSPNSSVEEEAINQFQVSVYFDDVTA